jgi:replicative DNA helicase
MHDNIGVLAKKLNNKQGLLNIIASKCISTGIKDLDTVTGKFYPGELVAIGNLYNSVNTEFSAHLVLNAILQNDVSIFVYTANSNHFTRVLLSQLSSVSLLQLNNAAAAGLDKNQIKNILAGAKILERADLHFASPVPNTTDSIFAQAQSVFNAQTESRRRLIIIDNLNSILIGKPEYLCMNRIDMLSGIVFDLKNIALTCEAPVIVTNSLKGKVKRRNDYRPELVDLQWPGHSLIKLSDKIIMFQHPYSFENGETGDNKVSKADNKKILTLIVSKNMQGTTGTATVHYQQALAKFSNNTTS